MSNPSFMVGLGHGQHRKLRTTKGSMELGTLGMTPDGRIWRYLENASTQLASGLLTCVWGIPNAIEETITVAHAIGATTLTVTKASVSKDDYRGGYIIVKQGTGAGEMHYIKGNTGTGLDGAPSGTMNLSLHDGDGLAIAWSTSDTDVDVYFSPYSNQILVPTDAQQIAVGVTQGVIPVDQFYWALVNGPGAMRLTGTTAGLELDEKTVVTSTANAGEGLLVAAAATAGRQVVGYYVPEVDIINADQEMVLVGIL